MKTAYMLLILVSLTACNAGTGFVTQENEITIGWVGPLTGGYAETGIPNMQGVELAVQRINEQGGINGKLVRLLIQDDQFDDRQTLGVYHTFRLQGADIILTPTYGATLTLADIALADGVLIINSLDASEELAAASDGLAAIGIYDESIGYAVADDINSQGYEKVSVLYNLADPFALLVLGAFEDRLETEPMAMVPYSGSMDDFRSELVKARGSDALFIIGFDETGLILKQAREQGLDAQLYTIDTLMSDNVLAAAGDAAYGVRFSYWEPDNTAVTEEFFQRYDHAFGGRPTNTLFTATGYDAATVVFEALKAQDDESLIKTLKALPPIDGVTATIDIEEDGISRSLEEVLFVYTPEGPVLS